MSIETRVIEIVSQVCRSNEINQNSSQENTPEWDSLAYLVICSELQLEFNLKIDESNFDKLSSIESIVNHIQKANASSE